VATDDTANVHWYIRVYQGKVDIQFDHPRTRILLDSENARVIAEAIAKGAYEARYGVKPKEGASQIGEMKRVALVATVAKIANSLAGQGKSNQRIAQAVVDAILQEVL